LSNTQHAVEQKVRELKSSGGDSLHAARHLTVVEDMRAAGHRLISLCSAVFPSVRKFNCVISGTSAVNPSEAVAMEIALFRMLDSLDNALTTFLSMTVERWQVVSDVVHTYLQDHPTSTAAGFAGASLLAAAGAGMFMTEFVTVAGISFAVAELGLVLFGCAGGCILIGALVVGYKYCCGKTVACHEKQELDSVLARLQHLCKYSRLSVGVIEGLQAQVEEVLGGFFPSRAKCWFCCDLLTDCLPDHPGPHLETCATELVGYRCIACHKCAVKVGECTHEEQDQWIFLSFEH